MDDEREGGSTSVGLKAARYGDSMRYICLMYDDQETFANFSEADRREAYAAFDALTEERASPVAGNGFVP